MQNVSDWNSEQGPRQTDLVLFQAEVVFLDHELL